MFWGLLSYLPFFTPFILHSMSAEIHISEVFRNIEELFVDGRQNVFSLAFIRDNASKNGPRGSIKHVTRCAKGTRTSKASKTTKTQQRWQFKMNNAIPLIDLDSGTPLTPKWTHLRMFNGKKIRFYGSK